MIGLYHLALPLVAHHLGLPLKGASKGLRSLEGIKFAYFDTDAEHVWVPEMARFQIAETLKPKDHKVAGVVNDLLGMRSSRFLSAFVEKYREPFSLESSPRWPEIRRALEGASKPLRSKEQEQEQEQEQEREPARSRGTRALELLRKRPLPEDFVLTDELRMFAIQHHLDVAEEFDKFRDHFIATGEGKADWAATWRNWTRRAKDFTPRGAMAATPTVPALPNLTARMTEAAQRDLAPWDQAKDG